MNTNEVINEVNEPINVKPKKKSILPIILLIGAVIAVIVFIYVYVNEQNAIKGETFMSLITKNQAVVEIFKKDENVPNDGETNYSLIFYNTSGDVETIDASIIVNEGNFDGRVKVNSEGTEKLFLEFIKEGDTFALYVPESYEKFIAISADGGIEVADKFGYDLSMLEEKEDMEDTKTLYKNLAIKYENVLSDSIGKYVKLKKNKEVEINGEMHNVDIYVLELDIKSFASIYREILGSVRKDTEALALITSIVANGSNRELETVYQEVVDSVESQYFALSLTGLIDESQNEKLMDIKVYAENGKAIKIQLISPDGYTDAEIYLEAIINENTDYIKFGTKDYLEEANFVYTAEKLEKEYNGELVIHATDGREAKLGIVSKKLENQTREMRKIEDVNHILLNNATDEELNDVCQKVFGMSLDEFAKSNREDDELVVPDEDDPYIEAEIKSEAYMVSDKINVGMTKEEAITVINERDADFTELEDGTLSVKKHGKEIVSVYFNEEGKVQLVYNHIWGTSKF